MFLCFLIAINFIKLAIEDAKALATPLPLSACYIIMCLSVIKSSYCFGLGGSGLGGLGETGGCPNSLPGGGGGGGGGF